MDAAEKPLPGWSQHRPIGYHLAMIPNRRRLAGTVLLLVFVFVYVVLAAIVAENVLPKAGGGLAFVYYAVAGLAWVPPAGLIISWMHRT